MNKHTFYTRVLLKEYGKVLLLLVIMFLSSACADNSGVPPQINQIELDPAFRAYYAHLGGQPILGEVISPMHEEGDIKVQYVEAGKLTLNPNAPKEEMLVFAPIGKDMGVSDPPVPAPVLPGPYHDGQHFIYPDFLPLYEQLGSEVFGPALSELHYNPVRKRYEQYFENLGIYRIEGTDEIHLLAYGIWECGDACKNVPGSDDAIVDISNHAEEVFSAYHKWVGDLLGFALSRAYINKYGAWEQIFENGVLMTNAEDVSQVFLRPVAKELHVPSDAPRVMNASEQGFFWEIKDGKGYFIPTHIWNYIAKHGGRNVVGAPISHYTKVKPNLFRQCFTNMCLNYLPNEIESVRIRPEPLGYVYELLFTPPEQPAFASASQEVRVTTIKAWERHPALASDQEQIIGISLLSNYAPVEDVLAELILFLPDGEPANFQFPPTDANGQAYLKLPFVVASNGTLVEYQVCVPLVQVGQKFCVGESFIIWNNP